MAADCAISACIGPLGRLDIRHARNRTLVYLWHRNRLGNDRSRSRVGISAVIMWQRGFPRRLLTYTVQVTTLVAAGRNLPKLKITYEDQAVRYPTLVTLTVESRSRRDIGSADFDDRQRLVFKLGAKIIAPVGPSADAVIHPAKVVSFDSDAVFVAPVIIRRGRLFRAHFLTDGDPRVTCTSPLLQVEVRELDASGQLRKRGPRFWIFLAAVGGIYLALPALWVNVGRKAPGHAVVGPLSPLGVSAFIIAGASLGVLIAIGWESTRGRPLSRKLRGRSPSRPRSS